MPAMIGNGVAPGFYNLEDRMSDTLQSFGYGNGWNLLQTSAQIHTKTINEMFRTSVDRVTWAKNRIRVAGGRKPQHLGQNDNPKPQRSKITYEVGLPLRIIGDSLGDNMWSRAETTLADLNADYMEIQMGMDQWMFDNFLSALFTNSSWDYEDDNDKIGTVKVMPLANGDNQLYPNTTGGTDQADHFLAQPDAIDDDHNPFAGAEGIYSTLKAHPINAGATIVVKVAKNLVESIKQLGGFKEKAELYTMYGANTDLASSIIDAFVGWGNEAVGVVDNCVIVRADKLPDNYMVAEAIGGTVKAVAMREPSNAQLRGLEVKPPFRVSSNLEQVDFYLRCGFGVQNRVGAVVMLIGAESYTPPIDFNGPVV
ncbi:hypothetical protein G4Y79_05195 [Phototrophicus methaneseepsis]|uniref:Capsid protein n=1 Tax=Phototrophicus methaneseepsis TaxID=2710758 RepID=A0A7S8IFN0_9CHLR|nr:hypothetical protein [Phototrophicus methaneseepsis]QPC83776.1 hypothetical protein G4Y79_05195 [Phototrophicus methaneseepsis]